MDRELYRVKRRGKTEGGGKVALVHSTVARKVRRSQDDKETEIRHKRRFFAIEMPKKTTKEPHFRTKMEARSSRSSREDNDVTARPTKRFHAKRRAARAGSSFIAENIFGSGAEAKRDTFGSGSGLWSSDLSGAPAALKRNDKRSTNSNSLVGLITALRAISAITPEEITESSKDETFSGSGLWQTKERDTETTTLDDKLPKFFEEEATSSSSGEKAEKALGMITETAEAQLKQKVEDASGLGSGTKGFIHHNGDKLFRRELPSDLLTDDLFAALESEKDSGDSEWAHSKALSGSGDETQETDTNMKGEPDVDAKPSPLTYLTKETIKKVFEQSNTKRTRSLVEVLLPDALHREKRNFPNSDGDLGENDALVSDSLVARFYQDQDAHNTNDVPDFSAASLPSEHEPASSTVDVVRRDFNRGHSIDLLEPRIVYTREIRNAPKPIIERPAVFSRSEDGYDMDTSYGGDNDDDDEPALVIHERDIREDGQYTVFRLV